MVPPELKKLVSPIGANLTAWPSFLIGTKLKISNVEGLRVNEMGSDSGVAKNSFSASVR